MFFLPFAIDVNLKRFPIVTVFIIIACLLIFQMQVNSFDRYRESAREFCAQTLTADDINLISQVAGPSVSCHSFFSELRSSPEPMAELDHMLEYYRLSSQAYVSIEDKAYLSQKLQRNYEYYDAMVPEDLSQSLAYNPEEINLIKMVTSTFAHSSWGHVIGNLIFFYVFAAAIEIIIGSLVFIGTILLMAITTSLAYSASVLGVAVPLPSVGLSGVVMGMMAMLAFLAPAIRIKCFLWFLIIFKVFRIPALFLAVWYIGWDLYNMKNNSNQGVDYVAHVSGALTGLIFAFCYRYYHVDYVASLKS